MASPYLGKRRPGTISFMAIDLLSDSFWKGGRKNMYHHELEAFIWILPFVFLRYQDKKAAKKSIVDSWMTSDSKVCKKEKSVFYQSETLLDCRDQVTSDFKACWPLAERLCAALQGVRWRRDERALLFETDNPKARGDVVISNELWGVLLSGLKFAAENLHLASRIYRLQKCRPRLSETE